MNELRPESRRVYTRRDLETCPYGHNRKLLDALPTVPTDSVGRFIIDFIARLAYAARGDGLLPIRAQVSLEELREMDYTRMRELAQLSPDYAQFVKEDIPA